MGGDSKKNFIAGSKYGESFSTMNRDRIKKWIPPPDIAKEFFGENDRFSATQSQ
jgi:hypothetical protein